MVLFSSDYVFLNGRVFSLVSVSPSMCHRAWHFVSAQKYLLNTCLLFVVSQDYNHLFMYEVPAEHPGKGAKSTFEDIA